MKYSENYRISIENGLWTTIQEGFLSAIYMLLYEYHSGEETRFNISAKLFDESGMLNGFLMNILRDC